MSNPFDSTKHPHRRYNPLLDEWILVSPQRATRPWQGQQETIAQPAPKAHDPNCYLCAGNQRANGSNNPNYEGVFVFENDFAALLKDEVTWQNQANTFFKLMPERGINKVICFSENHGITMPEMEITAIINVVNAWQQQYLQLSALEYINYIQIFENKGSVMGCSNPHPHGQIWAQSSIPTQVAKTQLQFQKYYQQHHTSLLADYLANETEAAQRIVLENNSFVALVPFWAVWPYETLIISKRKTETILDFSDKEKTDFALILKQLTTKYDNLFSTSFPYSAGIHQAPCDGKPHPEWHFHMHFYPPLLRSASIKKFMVGYEMLAEAQRDITAEQSADILKNLPIIHYKNKTTRE
ncbi:MAG: UDP-glucose--hexose-1-phosphate uridylyltransferase [Bacteroidia bacterium]|nr:UDP-glucose--hexose-1-phosphate uridylyltransferase [Bacteroidia bacterium]HQV00713.1 UDP-glucose--hexose-1-phosphate uridylyltransferase [Bacteroidia bacterium]